MMNLCSKTMNFVEKNEKCSIQMMNCVFNYDELCI